MQETQGRQLSLRSKTMWPQFLSKPVIIYVTKTKCFLDICPYWPRTPKHRSHCSSSQRKWATCTFVTFNFSKLIFHVPVASIQFLFFLLALFFLLHVCLIGSWFSLNLLNSFYMCVFKLNLHISRRCVGLVRINLSTLYILSGRLENFPDRLSF